MENMNKKVIVSKDPIENAKIKFIRAQNRVLRIQYGHEYLKNIQNISLDPWIRISMMFYFMEKFQMKKERIIFYNNV